MIYQFIKRFWRHVQSVFYTKEREFVTAHNRSERRQITRQIKPEYRSQYAPAARFTDQLKQRLR